MAKGVEFIQEPEAELSVPVGQTKLIETRRTLTRIAVANPVVANRVVGEVRGRTCILVDDMIDTAGTITKAAEALFKDGAAKVVVAPAEEPDMPTRWFVQGWRAIHSRVSYPSAASSA